MADGYVVEDNRRTFPGPFGYSSDAGAGETVWTRKRKLMIFTTIQA